MFSRDVKHFNAWGKVFFQKLSCVGIEDDRAVHEIIMVLWLAADDHFLLPTGGFRLP